MRLTTAGRFVRAMARQGVRSEAIRVEHLARIYARQIPYRDHADFTGIAPILSGLDQSTTQAHPGTCAVIVETRVHANTEFVVRNIHEHLKIPIYFFHGRSNKASIEETLGDLIAQEMVCLLALDTDVLTARLYNALLLSPQFWRAIPGTERVLIFQTDSMVCPQRSYGLHDFEGLDYVGSWWPVKRPIGFVIHGGNGGFSLRTKPAVLECLDRFPPDRWLGGEDSYFAFHMEIVGRVGSPADCARFATQLRFRFRSLGAQKITRLSSANKRRFIKYCPEAQILMVESE